MRKTIDLASAIAAAEHHTAQALTLGELTKAWSTVVLDGSDAVSESGSPPSATRPERDITNAQLEIAADAIKIAHSATGGQPCQCARVDRRAGIRVIAMSALRPVADFGKSISNAAKRTLNASADTFGFRSICDLPSRDLLQRRDLARSAAKTQSLCALALRA